MACPQCGFDPPTVSPGDAAVALRSFARRYRELIDPDDPDPNIEVQAGAAASAIVALRRDVEQVLVLDNPTLGASAPSSPTPSSPTTSSSSSSPLDDLAAVTARLADLVEHQPPDVWGRTGVRDGQSVTALELLREAVHAGVHHLRIARGDFS